MMRWPSTPSAGNTEMRVSGGVLTGVMVSGPLLGALGGAARREAEVACIVSYAGLDECGLGSLPGGDESELVKGVRALRAVWCPERDMAEGVEAMEEACVGVEAAESRSISSSRGRCALLSGEDTLALALVQRASPAAAVGMAAESACEATDGSARCEAARRRVRSSRVLRAVRDMDSLPPRLSEARCRGAPAHQMSVVLPLRPGRHHLGAGDGRATAGGSAARRGTRCRWPGTRCTVRAQTR